MDGPRVALEPVEQRAFCKRVVRKVIVRWNATLVAPPDLRPAPVELALRRFFVGLLGRRATRERDVSAFMRGVRQPLGDRRGNFVRVLDDDELDVVAHEPPAASSFERSIAAFLRDRHRRSLRPRSAGARVTTRRPRALSSAPLLPVWR